MPDTPSKAKRQPEVVKAEKLLGYSFKNDKLLEMALTHSSVADVGHESYERLEFFGDRILGLVLSAWLYKAFKSADQGELTNRFHALARGEYLAGICVKLGLQKCLLHEKGASTLAEQPSVQADIIEAVIAALYLDGGLNVAQKFIESHWQIEKTAPDRMAENPKSALQEWAAAQRLLLPKYDLISQTGSDHAPDFCVQVNVQGFTPQTGKGSSRKAAERAAATAFLKKYVLCKAGQKR